jgi:hypothetical protein
MALTARERLYLENVLGQIAVEQIEADVGSCWRRQKQV